MKLTPQKINTFLFFKLPSAWWCGVRLKSIDAASCSTTVKYRWINQNPFRSMYFAVQLMAAELSTGALVLQKIRNSNQNISMLVGSQQSVYHKKVSGRIFFTCRDGQLIDEAINKTIATGEGVTVTLKTVGLNIGGEIACEAEFVWTLKLRQISR